MLLAADHRDLHQPSSQLHRQPDRELQPTLDAGLHQQAVNHNFDRVVLALVELDLIFEVYAVRHRCARA